MAISALAWAIKQKLPRSAAKFVLVMLANYANEHGYAYPSIERLSQDTDQNRKTVIASLQALKKAKLITDTGKRIGATKQVVIYKLAVPKNETVPKTELLETVPKTDGKSPVLGWKQSRFFLKQSRKRNTEPLGTVSDPSGTNGSVEKVSIWNLTKALEAAEKIAKDLKERFSYENGFGVHWENEERRKEFQQVKSRVKELNRRIAMSA